MRPADPPRTLRGGTGRWRLDIPDERHTRKAAGDPRGPYPPRWTPSDELETRLEHDEQRLAAEEREARRLRALGLGLAVVLVLTIAALAVSVVALNRDIEAAATADPNDDSVGSAALQDGAVVAEKIAAGAVGSAQLADGAVGPAALAEGSVTSAAFAPQSVVNAALAPSSVGTRKLSDGAVTAPKVAADALTGDEIAESTLAAVPEALRAETAEQAADADRLGGLAPAAYLSSVELVSSASDRDGTQVKEVVARCPAGTVVVGGGGALDEASPDIALVASAPSGESAWVVAAAASAERTAPWQLTATAVCAAGGG